MSHRAAIYNVRIRPLRARTEWCPLGDYDRYGTWAGQTIADILHRLEDYSSDGNVYAQYEADLSSSIDSSFGITILSGRSGVTSVLQKPGEHDFFRTPEHSEAMRSAVLFLLPPFRTTGRLIVHAPHGRSCKSIVQNQLRQCFSQLGYYIDLPAVIPANALHEALRQNALQKVTLIKYDPDRSDKFQDAAQWGNDEVGRLELAILSRRGGFLRRDPVRRFLEDPTEENRNQIIEFGGLIFDDVSVTVKLRNNTQRTFYLEAPSRGHAMTAEINISEEDEYGATGLELSRELVSVMRDVVQGD